MPKLSIIYTTVGSEEDARALAERAVSGGHAACVNIFPGVEAFYKWEGKVQQDKEVAMIFKVARSGVDDLSKWLEVEHPYEVPALLCGEVSTSDGFYRFIEEAGE